MDAFNRFETLFLEVKELYSEIKDNPSVGDLDELESEYRTRLERAFRDVMEAIDGLKTHILRKRIKAGDVEAVNELLESPLDFSNPDLEGGMKEAVQKGSLEVVNMFLDVGAPPDDALFFGVKENKVEMVKHILDRVYKEGIQWRRLYAAATSPQMINLLNAYH